jgi:hypothetical protein
MDQQCFLREIEASPTATTVVSIRCLVVISSWTTGSGISLLGSVSVHPATDLN